MTRAAMTAVFVANGLAFGAWAASIPRVRAGAGLSDGTLGVLLLCISLGAVAAMQVAGRYAGNGPGQIGTARACVVGSTVWPAWMARVPKWWFGGGVSAMSRLLRCVRLSAWERIRCGGCVVAFTRGG